jgi:hypothetical protein
MTDDAASIKRLEDLRQDEQNANAGTDRGMFSLRESVIRFGVGRGVVVDKKGRLIGGNKTHQVLSELGGFNVQVVPTTGDTLVVTQRLDLDLDDTEDPAARELAFADNRAQELNLAWDAQQVAAGVEQGLDLGAFFHQHELDAIINELAAEEDEAEEADDHDPVPEMTVQPFEHYDYVMVVFRNTWDWSQAVDLLGIRPEGFSFTTSKGARHRKVGLCRVVDGQRFLERWGQHDASRDPQP